MAVMEEVADIFLEKLIEGHAIQLKGIGTFPITTKELQSLCGLSNHTALRRLKERVKAGKMTHPGNRYSAFYFPVPGNYGISRNKYTSSAL